MKLFTIILINFFTFPLFSMEDPIIPFSHDTRPSDIKIPTPKKQKIKEETFSEEENSEENSEEDSFLDELDYDQGLSNEEEHKMTLYLFEKKYKEAAKAFLERVWSGNYDTITWARHNLNLDLFDLYTNEDREGLINLIPEIEKRLREDD